MRKVSQRRKQIREFLSKPPKMPPKGPKVNRRWLLELWKTRKGKLKP